ncbi:hypothetical protein LEP1GSC132_4266 [Leptospira kirschneri str. 200803703]|nr:hypothetical protein LEP1GSC132_4266 [Leptospira kirschneri str. 200803703]EMO81732.1 hypothetical protein LEP1GSC126_0579 [Leptospira kirschneri str. 200801774]EPG49533.1 hypothetical protein LEP1GSC049_1083 [Leptospira kirschneri serovar Cynopteri str. 3522 CT]
MYHWTYKILFLRVEILIFIFIILEKLRIKVRWSVTREWIYRLWTK